MDFGEHEHIFSPVSTILSLWSDVQPERDGTDDRLTYVAA